MGLRSRNIKPGFFANEVLGGLPHWQRLLFAGLWCVADREGRFEVRPKRIKRELFPDEAIDVAEGIAALAGADPPFLTIYEIDGKQYAQVENWGKHQSPHHREAASIIPPRSASVRPHPSLMHGPCTADAWPEQVASCPPDSLIPDSGLLIPDTGPTALAPLTLPEWLSPELWQRWDAFRKSLGRKAWTDDAKALSLQRLEKFRNAGHSPKAVIEQSIGNGWRGLFAIKGESNGSGNAGRGVADRVADNVRRRRGNAAPPFPRND